VVHIVDMDTTADNHSNQDNDNISYAAAAGLLGLPRGTLYWLVAEKRIPHIRLGRRLVRFSKRDLHQWLADHAVAAQEGRGK